jgi:hypothetical protein
VFKADVVASFLALDPFVTEDLSAKNFLYNPVESAGDGSNDDKLHLNFLRRISTCSGIGSLNCASLCYFQKK